MEEESKPVSSRIQKEAACDVIIKNYSFLVGHVDAIRIFPQLVSSRLVEPDFRQRLDCRQTDRDKMMALLHELIRCTEETWFDGFTNALSKVPQYRNVADTLLAGDCPRTHHIHMHLLHTSRDSARCHVCIAILGNPNWMHGVPFFGNLYFLAAVPTSTQYNRTAYWLVCLQ